MSRPSGEPQLRHRAEGPGWTDLAFELALPAGWTVSARAAAEPAFATEHAALQTLLQAHSTDAACELEVAARPCCTASPLLYSAVYLMGEHGIALDEDGDDRPVGAHAALSGPGWQTVGGRRLALHYAFFEDGGRLLHLALRGPQAQRSALAALWQQICSSFRLARPLGPTVPLASHAPAAETAPAGPPPWWRAAEALEQGGDIAQALQAVDRGCDQLGALLAKAELQARRMRRLAAAGDAVGARLARQQAEAWARAYAAGATSGGEGSALARERDRFIADLGDAGR